MNFQLIDLRSQAYAVEQLFVGKSETAILEWLKTKGKLEEREQLSSKFTKVFQFSSLFNFEAVFWLENSKFIFIGEHNTFNGQ